MDKKEKAAYDEKYYQDHLEEKRKYRKIHREHKHAQSKEYRTENAEAIAVKKKQYHKDHPEVELRRLCKKKGITLEQYYSFPQECGACHTKDPGSRNGKKLKSFPIDHDHNLQIEDPKYVRGLLCQPCNLAAGHLKDDPKRCRGLEDYLLSRH